MYPSNIQNITKCGILVDEELRQKIKQESKKATTIEDKKRILSSIYESNSQPFIYYDEAMDDSRLLNASAFKKKQSKINSNIPGPYNSNSLNDKTSSVTSSSTGNTLEALKEKIFRIFEEKGEDGVSMKEIEERTLKPKHIIKKIIDEIALQTGRGGRRHIWYLKPHYSAK
ncbi:transcription initiation factor IIF/Rap30 like winged HTH [Cryptosporidium ryanae]|uniref:transcription initiation factor IIF/Rap30 like winged HTH n=1 Tax=Cryptosporidium ryanae TaxID=515981 RepID=UPI00351A3057|nr:transcription initiation factor IIF/Rap30 like winged HTH [Cryptosporidium ryanae]